MSFEKKLPSLVPSRGKTALSGDPLVTEASHHFTNAMLGARSLESRIDYRIKQNHVICKTALTRKPRYLESRAIWGSL